MPVKFSCKLRDVDLLKRKSLHNKRVLALDLSAIMAGSGIRGAFEEKFKALIRDIEDEVCMLITHLIQTLIVLSSDVNYKGGNAICFIDELRTLRDLYDH